MSETKEEIAWKYTSTIDQDRLRRIINSPKPKDMEWLIHKIQESWTRVDMLSESIIGVCLRNAKDETRDS